MRLPRCAPAEGGEVRAAGNGPGGDGWVVEVERPGTRVPRQTITLRNQACATSGGSEQNKPSGDDVVTHLIDPRTGRPMREPGRSVTIIADSCMLADAWATALAVDQGPEMVHAAQQAGVRWLDEP